MCCVMVSLFCSPLSVLWRVVLLSLSPPSRPCHLRFAFLPPSALFYYNSTLNPFPSSKSYIHDMLYIQYLNTYTFESRSLTFLHFRFSFRPYYLFIPGRLMHVACNVCNFWPAFSFFCYYLRIPSA
ncbi:hypothetical protein BDZ97DRAFT_1805680 [Flammula alnicola]|nr:hypothetical protein BDZ97DRAFT_1805680 [Flammula alnicola]